MPIYNVTPPYSRTRSGQVSQMSSKLANAYKTALLLKQRRQQEQLQHDKTMLEMELMRDKEKRLQEELKTRREFLKNLGVLGGDEKDSGKPSSRKPSFGKPDVSYRVGEGGVSVGIDPKSLEDDLNYWLNIYRTSLEQGTLDLANQAKQKIAEISSLLKPTEPKKKPKPKKEPKPPKTQAEKASDKRSTSIGAVLKSPLPQLRKREIIGRILNRERIEVIAPDGTPGDVSAQDLEEALKQGYKLR